VRTLDLLQFKVMDFFGGHTQLPSQERQKCWVVIFLNTRGKSRLFVPLVFIELIRDLAENRNELRLLVELEVVVNVPVDLNMREPWHEGGWTCYITYDG